MDDTRIVPEAYTEVNCFQYRLSGRSSSGLRVVRIVRGFPYALARRSVVVTRESQCQIVVAFGQAEIGQHQPVSLAPQIARMQSFAWFCFVEERGEVKFPTGASLFLPLRSVTGAMPEHFHQAPTRISCASLKCRYGLAAARPLELRRARGVFWPGVPLL